MAKVCPLLTFDPAQPEGCIEHRCAFYTQVQGQHPQTGEVLNEWGCAIAWMPVLTIETSQQTRQAGAAVESLRNEVSEQQERSRQVFAQLESARRGLEEKKE